MRPYEVEEKDKHRDEIIGRIKRRESLFCFVPSFELFVKALNEVIGNIILKALHTDEFGVWQDRLHRHLVGAVAVADNSGWSAQLLAASSKVKACGLSRWGDRWNPMMNLVSLSTTNQR